MALTTNEYNYLINQAKVAFIDPDDYTYALAIINNAPNFQNALDQLNEILPNSRSIVGIGSSWGQEQTQQQIYNKLTLIGYASLAIEARTLLGYDTPLTYSNTSFGGINEIVNTIAALYPNGTSYNTTIAGDVASLKEQYGYTLIQPITCFLPNTQHTITDTLGNTPLFTSKPTISGALGNCRISFDSVTGAIGTGTFSDSFTKDNTVTTTNIIAALQAALDISNVYATPYGMALSIIDTITTNGATTSLTVNQLTEDITTTAAASEDVTLATIASGIISNLNSAVTTSDIANAIYNSSNAVSPSGDNLNSLITDLNNAISDGNYATITTVIGSGTLNTPDKTSIIGGINSVIRPDGSIDSSLISDDSITGSQISTGANIMGYQLSANANLLGMQMSANANLVGTQLSPSANVVGTQLSAGANINGSQLSPNANIVGTQLSQGANIAGTQISPNANIVGTQLSAAANIAGTQLSNGANINGSQLSPNANVAGTQLSQGANIAGTQLSPNANLVGTQLSAGAHLVGTQLSAGANINGSQLSPNANVVGTQLSPNANIVGTQLSAAANIAGTQLSQGSNILGSQLSANAAISSEQITSLDEAKVTLTSSISNIDGYTTPSEVLGNTALSSYTTGLTISQQLSYNQRDIGNVYINYPQGSLFYYPNSSPASLSYYIGTASNSFDDSTAQTIAYYIVTVIGAASPLVSVSTMATDITNSLSYGNGFPSDTGTLGNYLGQCFSTVDRTPSTTASQVANCIYTTDATYTAYGPPIHISSSTNLNNLITDIENSLPTLTKIIGFTNLNGISDGTITGAIGTTYISLGTQNSGGSYSITNAIGSGTILGAYNSGVGSTIVNAIGNTPLLGDSNQAISIAAAIGNNQLLTSNQNLSGAINEIYNGGISGLDGSKITGSDLVGTQLSAAANIAGTQLSQGSNILGSQLSANAAISSEQITSLDEAKVTLTSSISNIDGYTTPSEVLGNTALSSYTTGLTISQQLSYNQRDIGNVYINYPQGSLFYYPNSSPASLSYYIGTASNSFDDSTAQTIAYYIVTVIGAASPLVSVSTMATDITNSLSYGNGFPSDTGTLGNYLGQCFSTVDRTPSTTASQVANCIYTTDATYTAYGPPIHISSSTNLNNLITDIENSLPTLTKIIGFTNLNGISDGTITGAIGTTYISLGTQNSGGSYSITNAIGSGTILGAYNSGVGSTIVNAIGNTPLLGDSNQAISIAAAIGNNQLLTSNQNLSGAINEIYNGGISGLDGSKITGSDLVGTQLSAAANIAGTQLSQGANLVGTQLSAGAHLVGTQLSAGANIIGSQLSPNANILGTQLSPNANLVGTQISAGAHLVGTQLSAGANIQSTQIASLNEAQLSLINTLETTSQDLSGAVNELVGDTEVSAQTIAWYSGAYSYTSKTATGRSFYACEGVYTETSSGSYALSYNIITPAVATITTSPPTAGEWATAEINCVAWAMGAWNNNMAEAYSAGSPSYKEGVYTVYFSINGGTCTPINTALSGSLETICKWGVYH